MNTGEYPDDGLGEIFLKVSKQGSTLSGIMDAFAISLSLGLQYGVPLEAYISKFMNMRFEPAGMTDDPDVRLATSIVDYVFRRLALDYLDEPTRRRLGIMSSEERAALVKGDEHGNGNGNGNAECESPAPADASCRADAGEDRRRLPRRGRAESPEVGSGRRALLLQLRKQDATGRLVLRVRVVRLDQRLLVEM